MSGFDDNPFGEPIVDNPFAVCIYHEIQSANILFFFSFYFFTIIFSYLEQFFFNIIFLLF